MTNPPWSLFREYVEVLMEQNKKFLIIGNKNSITYKEFFPLIKENKVWLGYNSPSTFNTPNSLTKKVAGLGRWFTNLDIPKRHEKLILWKNYTPEEYPKYDNYDAINVDKVAEIPVDYDGIMGVPITFLDKYSPEQFEIVGCADANIVPDGWQGASKEFVDLYYLQGNTGQYHEGNRLACYIKNGKAKVPYKRVLIKYKSEVI